MNETKVCSNCGKFMILWPPLRHEEGDGKMVTVGVTFWRCFCGNEEPVIRKFKSFKQTWEEANKK